MLKMKSTKMMAMLVALVLLSGVIMPAPANAADLFDRIAAITSKGGVIKVALIYIAFLVGIGGLLWGGLEMLKLSKPENRGEATWAGVGVKMIAGVVLIGLTATSDTMSETIFGTRPGQPTNTSMYIDVIAKPYFG
jgi:hypothetical protein